MESLEIIPANPDTLLIMRLFLEKLELLTPQERQSFGKLMEEFTSPTVMMVQSG